MTFSGILGPPIGLIASPDCRTPTGGSWCSAGEFIRPSTVYPVVSWQASLGLSLAFMLESNGLYLAVSVYFVNATRCEARRVSRLLCLYFQMNADLRLRQNSRGKMYRRIMVANEELVQVVVDLLRDSQASVSRYMAVFQDDI